MNGTGTDKVYAYRWIVLSAFVLVACMTQILWISFAPITSAAAKFYGTSVLNIGLLSMSLHDRLHPDRPAVGLGDRHLGVQDSGRHRRRPVRPCSP